MTKATDKQIQALKNAFFSVKKGFGASLIIDDKSYKTVCELGRELELTGRVWQKHFMEFVIIGRQTVNGVDKNTLFDLETSEPFETFYGTVRSIEFAKKQATKYFGIRNDDWVYHFYGFLKNRPYHNQSTFHALKWLDLADWFHPEWSGKPELTENEKWHTMYVALHYYCDNAEDPTESYVETYFYG